MPWVKTKLARTVGGLGRPRNRQPDFSEGVLSADPAELLAEVVVRAVTSAQEPWGMPCYARNR
jgi:hypothetical protein